MSRPDGEEVRAGLGLGVEHAATFAALDEIRPSDQRVDLPGDARAVELLARCGVAERDRREVLAARPSPSTHPELWWLLERCVGQLRQRMGDPDVETGWPRLPPRWGAYGRYFYVWVLLAGVPQVREFHARRGIPAEATWEILAELGVQLGYGRSIGGTGGLHAHNWMTMHFGGALYRVGRLIFERALMWRDVPAGPGEDEISLPRKGERVLGVHIPRGPLTPAACDESFARAKEFFARHFPEETYRFATCVSWVLDEQLIHYLSADSRILRFQRRFRLLPPEPGDEDGESDRSTVESIFARRWPGVEGLGLLPYDTTLEKAVVDHLRAGGHWRSRAGWLEL